MSSFELNIDEIPILRGQANYREWSLEIKATAKLGGFWKAILGTNTTTSTDASEIDKIEQREEKAIGLITKTVSGFLKVELHELRVADTSVTGRLRDPTAKELWDHLKGKFEKEDGISAILDLRQLTRTKFTDDGTLEAQLNTFQEVRSRCTRNGIKFEDWQYATLMLLALPENYSHIADSFLAAGAAKDLKSSEVHAKILKTKILHKADVDSNTNSLSAKPSGSGKNRNPPPGRPCFECGKEGHWVRHCRAKPKDNNAVAGSSNSK